MVDLWPFPPRRYRHRGCSTVLLIIQGPANAAMSSERCLTRRGNGQMIRPPAGSQAIVGCPDCRRVIRLLGSDGSLNRVDLEREVLQPAL